MSVKDFIQQRRDDFIALCVVIFICIQSQLSSNIVLPLKVAEKLISLGYDVALGAEVLDLDSRMGLPSEGCYESNHGSCYG